MNKKVKNKLGLFLSMVLICTSSILVHASSQTEIATETVKGIAITETEQAEDTKQFTETATETVTEGKTPDPRIPNVSTDGLKIKGSEYKEYRFALNIGTNFHDTFKTTFYSAQGSFKILITSSTGYSYTSNEYHAGQEAVVTVKNCPSGAKYVVKILNTTTTELIGNVRISSYYE